MIVLYYTETLFVIVPREEPQTQTDGEPFKTMFSQFFHSYFTRVVAKNARLACISGPQPYETTVICEG